MAVASKQAAREEVARGCTLLRDGRFAEGWVAYEARHRLSGPVPRVPGRPAWRGEPLAGRSVLVLREQGVGDEVWLASCIPDLVERAERVSLTCDRRLVELFRRSFSRVAVLGEGAAPVDHDYWVMLGDLGRYFRPEKASFHGASYLVAEDAARAHWRRILGELGPGPKVGLAWQGGANLNELRQASWSTFEEPMRVPGVTWIDLQYGDNTRVLDLVRERFGCRMVHFEDLDLFEDLDSTAALVAELDLVVAVPSTVVHLAGSLGTPIRMLFDPRWGCLWVTHGVEVPWYASLEVLRLGPERDWRALGARLAAELREPGFSSPAGDRGVAPPLGPAPRPGE